LDLRPKQTSFGPAVRISRQRSPCFSPFARSALPRSDLRPSLSWTRPWSHRRLPSSPAARYGPPDAHRPPSRQRRTEVQMKAAGQNEMEEHEECGGRLRCPSMPTSLALKRRGGRPSTPKGVALARLTATHHDAEGAAMSADQGRRTVAGRCSGVGLREKAGLLGPGSGCEQGYGRGCESHVRTNSALHGGWRRPPAADHPQSPLTLNMSGDWWWSAAGGLVFGGGPSWGGRGAVAGPGGTGERGASKPGRNQGAFRLVSGWWW
jgi:hypothetical protein